MKLFNSNLPKASALAFILAASSTISLTAQAEPAPKEGNPGVPGLVNVLETQINDQDATIEDLQATIDALQAALVPAPVPKSGQMEMHAIGDDGDVQAGAVPFDSRFTNNLDGTVTDNLTGLIWLQDASCDSFGFYGNGLVGPWENAVDAANMLMDGECGLSDGSVAGDWRMPNIKELQSLIDYGNVGPAVPTGHPFADIQTIGYWSSTTPPAGFTTVAWAVNFGSGSTGADPKFFDSFLWPVRGGQ